ncbi:histidine-rich protein PFHRP-II-like [Harpegnathos saltator]|uniref:histidine-rich protein PFHRP-II-like n=1 Tax=Harpegnathos saltator TaxID=610380 RepID=UPI00058E3E48|nr:histidine-rich protein PFHRP-II-like [Harpegnathos saltator]
MRAAMRTLIVVLSCLAWATLASAAYAPYQEHGVQGYYHGPLAPLAHDGRVVDTPEVAHAKKAHLAAHAAEAAKNAHHGYHAGYHADDGQGVYHHGAHHHVAAYHGPPAPLGHDGRVVDTPEVAHAKAAHLAAHAEEVAKVAHISHHYSHPKW